MKFAALLTLVLAAGMPVGIAHAQQAAQLPWQSHVSLVLERADDGFTSLQQLLEHDPSLTPDLNGRTFSLE